MGAKWIGAHMPGKGGLARAIRSGAEIGCTAVQVFTSSPQQWRAKSPTADAIAEFRDAVNETGITHLISHDSYLVNLCSPLDEIREKSILALRMELERCAAYGIPLVVSHIGAHMGAGIEQALPVAAQSIRQVLDETPDSVTLLIENTAGQGSVLDSTFEEIARLMDLVKRHRLGVCLDTCHLFAAGYDLRKPETWSRTMAEFDRLVGFSALKAVHANDSKKGLGSHVDRHEHIGKGALGLGAFRSLVCDPRMAEIPIVVETPDAEKMHGENVACLWKLAKGCRKSRSASR
jgi:deoxyribonuclease-4